MVKMSAPSAMAPIYFGSPIRPITAVSARPSRGVERLEMMIGSAMVSTVQCVMRGLSSAASLMIRRVHPPDEAGNVHAPLQSAASDHPARLPHEPLQHGAPAW